MMQHQTKILVVGIGLAVLLAGCSPKEQAEAERTAKELGSEASNAAKAAATQAQPALNEAGKKLSDGAITLRVKTAMTTSGKLDSSGIDVSTKNRTVYLQGQVPDAGQKALAQRIAHDTVEPDVKVVNQLAVAIAAGRPAKSVKPTPQSHAPKKP